MLNEAINTNEFEDWLNFKNNRNNTQKMVKDAKKQYTTNKINNSHIKWRTIKNINNVNQQHPPNKIIYNNNIITSPVKICNIAVNHFVNKISKIRQKFKQPKFDPIDIIKNLVPKCNNKLTFPRITKSKTLKIINN